MHDRPACVTPKSKREQEYHMRLARKLYDDLRRENEVRAREKINIMNNTLKLEEEVSYRIAKWRDKILPNWQER